MTDPKQTNADKGSQKMEIKPVQTHSEFQEAAYIAVLIAMLEQVEKHHDRLRNEWRRDYWANAPVDLREGIDLFFRSATTLKRVATRERTIQLTRDPSLGGILL